MVFLLACCSHWGRALGETMAVTMLIGNATRIPNSLFSLGNTFGERDRITVQ